MRGSFTRNAILYSLGICTGLRLSGSRLAQYLHRAEFVEEQNGVQPQHLADDELRVAIDSQVLNPIFFAILSPITKVSYSTLLFETFDVCDVVIRIP